jgi:hypothetical protein
MNCVVCSFPRFRLKLFDGDATVGCCDGHGDLQNLCYPDSSCGDEESFCRGLQSGRGSAWLERLVRDQEVGGSNPLAPTTFS